MQKLMMGAFVMMLGVAALHVTAAEEATDGPVWGTDYAAAVAESEKSGKPILIDFTGSDWCPPCMKQHAEVYGNADWKAWAKENVVLYIADFPNRKKLDDKVKAQNEELKKKYSPSGFPTVLFVNAKGEELGRWVGYGGKASGAAAWIEKAKPIVAKAKESTEKK